jgi:hypothetical protein
MNRGFVPVVLRADAQVRAEGHRARANTPRKSSLPMLGDGISMTLAGPSSSRAAFSTRAIVGLSLRSNGASFVHLSS